jgi:integrase
MVTRTGAQVNKHLTKNAVEELEPPASGYYIAFDDKLTGFGVRVTAAGVKSFVYDYRVGGKKRRYTIGKFGPQWSVALARDEVEIKLGPNIGNGGDPAGEKKARLAEPKMADLATDYIEQHAKAKKSDKSVYEDRRMLKNIILPKLGKVRVSDVSRRNVKMLHNSLKKTPYQANRVLALLSNMFTFAMDDNRRPDNPAKGIERFTEDKREAWFSVDQLHAISDALDSYDEQDAADALRLLIVTGARPGEVIGATWPMFDLKRGVWTKPSHHTKERKIEHVRLNQNAMTILRRMAENKGAGIYLFPGRDVGTARTTLRNAWKQVCRSAGFATEYSVKGKRGKPLRRWKPNVRVYDLRHTFASILISRNWSLQLVGKLLGHTQAATTERYAHVADSALRDVTNDFDNVMVLPARSA